ncbi:MAG: glycosyltransferase family 4 protein [Desulfobacterales bacterium]|nr:glycosyltransferase family 4 protein [Desulfobacterales bacterium]
MDTREWTWRTGGAEHETMKTVLFYRRFRGFTGGHLKVWDYFNHVRRSEAHTPEIIFSRDSTWNETNPWRGLERHVRGPDAPPRADILFIAGMDWQWLTKKRGDVSSTPVINLIQGIRHAWPNDPRYAFLGRRAIRICVSEQVGEALRGANRTRGPLFVIPNGIDRRILPKPRPLAERDLDYVIVANKQLLLGHRMKWRLDGPRRRIRLLTGQIPRPDFLRLLNRSRITVFLPNPAEGFYLPALEGMAMGTVVVCPDCVGNRSFCLPGRNCLRPEYETEAIRSAAETAGRLPPDEMESLRVNARETAARHDLMKERDAFLDILENVDQLW